MNSEERHFLSAVAADVRIVCAVDDSQIDTICARLGEATGYLGSSRLKKVIGDQVSDQEAADAVFRLVLGLHEWVHESDVDIDELSSAIWEHKDDGEIDEEQFRQRVRQLSGPFQAIARQAKAIRVTASAGSRLTEFRFICDLRPVYKVQDRSEIEGLVPLTTLTMETRNASGATRRVEAILSASDLTELVKEAEMAQKKLDELAALAERTELPIPDLSITRRVDVEGTE